MTAMPNNVDGLNARDKPTFVDSKGVARGGFGQPLRKSIQVSLPWFVSTELFALAWDHSEAPQPPRSGPLTGIAFRSFHRSSSCPEQCRRSYLGWEAFSKGICR